MNIEKSDGLLTFSDGNKELLILVSRKGSCLLVRYFNGTNANSDKQDQADRFYVSNMKEFIEQLTECYNDAVKENIFNGTDLMLHSDI